MIARRLGWVCALCLLATGCGYRAGSLISPDIRTVHVAMFDNADFRHEIEVPLTEAVAKEITRRTHLRLADRATADTVLLGAITQVTASVTAYSASDEVFSQDLTVYVRFEWRWRADNALIVGPTELSSAAQVMALRGETQGTATSEAFDDLAELIVEKMQEDF